MKYFSPSFTIFLCLFSYQTSFSQDIEISGKISDSLNQAIPYVSVIAFGDKLKKNILSYTTSNVDGSFKLIIRQSIYLDSIWLSFSHVSFMSKIVQTEKRTQIVNAQLSTKSNNLDEVFLESTKSLTIKGDTLVYNVSKIKKEKDYSIETVINRIPGISISENGQIKYNNKPISHLYINGLDLLEGRYNIATRGIPAEAVKDIEILQNHNHAKIERGKTLTDKVAINLQIKENRSLIFGSLKGDIGLPLIVGRADATPIFITDKVQDIASIKVNNIGESLQFNGIILTEESNVVENIKLDELNILSPPNTNGFGLNRNYWIDNESYSITNDVLIKRKNDVNLKIAANYNRNNEKFTRQSSDLYFFDNDSILVNRKSNDNLDKRDYFSSVIYEVNKDKLFLKNKSLFKGTIQEGFSTIIQNDNPLLYNYENQKLKLSNLLEVKSTFNDKIVNSGLIIEYQNGEEITNTTPPVFTDIIPNNMVFFNTEQNLQISQFNLGLFSSLDFEVWKFKSRLTQIIEFKSENMKSNLFQKSDMNIDSFDFPFSSHFTLNTIQSKTKLFSSYTLGNIDFIVDANLEYIKLNQNEIFQSTSSKKNDYLFLQPSFALSYKINEKWRSSARLNYNNKISNFSQLYNGLILRDFTSLYQNPSLINNTQNLNVDLNLSYRDILKGFYFNNNFQYNNTKSDFTFVSTLNDNGLIQIAAENRPNTMFSLSNSTSLTKRFFQILETELTYSFNYFNTEQIFNEIVQNNLNTTHSIVVEVELDNNTWYGIKYYGNYNRNLFRVDSFKNSNVFFKNRFEFDIYTTEKSRINLGYESVLTSFSKGASLNNNEIYDLSIFYKPNKKLFLRASIINIFNTGFFSTIASNANIVSQSRFSLRPRQITVGFNYSL